MGKHSSNSTLKRKLENKEERIPETIYTLVTKGSKASCFEELTPQKIKGSRRYVDVCGGHLIIKLQNFYTQQQYQPVLEFMLNNENCIGDLTQTRRGLGRSAHLGCWTTRGGKFYKVPRPTKETAGDLARQLMKLAAPLAKKAGWATRVMFPGMATVLSTIPQHLRPFDLWPLLIANFLSPTKKHKDHEDYPAGFCVVVPLGIFNGGELYFEELNLTIPVHNGDLVMFRSDLLTHEVLEYEGLRMSLIFTCHNRFMKWIQRDFSQNSQDSTDLERLIDSVVNWGEALNAKTASSQEAEESEEDEENENAIAFPLVGGHSATNRDDSYPLISIPQWVTEAREEREQEKPCKK
mmetsp:Transcript_15399/g.21470  ORF Transcript_15399/g.21470 Transcript_15399/m.21470 type:complete len:351 (+) Transcript_15399:111-1163(+)|eukprot:CAMPEP_0168551458 /NCGR_PEP_ID=MMETSP0413-20121227/6183_1 /TAXON_ID=136452 /ORGANISM="Filamoeba nolandi, Strain NC-AS-23-1" /LENGTH=350 /DNA_ID=CAMNT_0008581985 /DNA_START=613 /DNA_END=1665 /DNA_ORIENTATION=-